jgi:hypothetical protein
MKSGLFWDITQRIVVIRYRRFGTLKRGVISQKSADQNGMSCVKPVHRDMRGIFAVYTFVFSALYEDNIMYLYMASKYNKI